MIQRDEDRTEKSREFESVLAKAKMGDSQGFATLYSQFNRQVGAFARSEGCPDPDELVNTIFFKAFRSIDRFTGIRANFASYLYQIARFQIIDDRRARNRRADALSESPIEFPESDANPATTEVGDATARTYAALQSLTPEQREVLVLRVFFELTGPETATALEKPVSAVRSLQNRAESRLRQLVETGAVRL